ncbi:TetR family transcriptional regulator [Pseudonocardia sp. NPDC046786]|uniref:TetR family transcriptional regulator n=1 Tax=Pseudonocardia sp. NPDC046786 TaxID=3155471 RepID=UPI003401FD6D
MGSPTGRASGALNRRRFVDPDRTAVARIRDAAIAEFAEHGVAGATLKSVAAAAGVSAQLVVHHFGSKEGLATACDEYVLALFREHNTSLLSSGGAFAPVQSLEAPWLGPAMGYLSARLADDSPAVAQLVDEALQDALSYLDAGVQSGLVKPSEFPRERAVVGLLWNLGALVLHRHAKRLMGVDLMAPDTRQRLTWSLAATEMLTEGLFHQEAYEKLKSGSESMGSEDPADGT